MSVSSAFNARIMKERKMFIFNPPPGISEHGANMQGFVYPVDDSLYEYKAGMRFISVKRHRSHRTRRLSI